MTISNTAFSQQWVNDYLAEVGFGNPDSIVAHFHSEMEKEIGKVSPNLSFISISNGQSYSLHSFNDKPTIVLFWKTGCSGSTMQLSELSLLLEDSSYSDLNILYLSPNSLSDIEKFKQNGDYYGMFGKIDTNELEHPFQLFATPSVYILDEQGQIQSGWLSPKDVEALKTEIEPYF